MDRPHPWRRLAQRWPEVEVRHDLDASSPWGLTDFSTDPPTIRMYRHLGQRERRAVHYETRSVHAVAVPDVTAGTLMPALADVMDLKRTHLHTDGASAYKSIAKHVYAHEFVDHESGEYTKGNVSTNLVEGFFSQLKRSIDGTHHAVSREHLNRYLTQMSFMYTHRRATDSQRMRTLLGNVEGRRLPYKPLTEG